MYSLAYLSRKVAFLLLKARNVRRPLVSGCAEGAELRLQAADLCVKTGTLSLGSLDRCFSDFKLSGLDCDGVPHPLYVQGESGGFLLLREQGR